MVSSLAWFSNEEIEVRVRIGVHSCIVAKVVRDIVMDLRELRR